jgi:outer membrane protein OmpA-like peptidoglycan-associated protein
MSKNHLNQKGSVVAPVLILMLVILIAIVWGVPHEQRALQEDVLEELAAAGIQTDNIDIHFEGRDAYIEGKNISLDEVRQLREKIENVPGVRTVSYKTVNYTIGTTPALPAVIPPTDISAKLNNDNAPIVADDNVVSTAVSEETVEESDTGLISKAAGLFSKMTDLVKSTPAENTHEAAPDVASAVVETQIETRDIAVSDSPAADSAESDTGLVSQAVGMLTKMGDRLKDKVNGENTETEATALLPESITANAVATSGNVLQKQLDQPLLSGSMLFRPATMQWPLRMHQSLMEFAIFLKQYPDLMIEIGGFSGPVGSSEYAMQLSEERAQQVKVYLVYQGVSAEQLSVKGYGFDPERMRDFPVPSSIRFYMKGE